VDWNIFDYHTLISIIELEDGPPMLETPFKNVEEMLCIFIRKMLNVVVSIPLSGATK